ncbi:tetratricopeptide repeat protein [Luteimonas sp. A611]
MDAATAGAASTHVRDDSIGALLQRAVARHADGALDAAQALYGQVLARAPEQPDALHFLGVLRHQQGDSEAAIALIERALEQLPRHADIHNNLGNVHKERGCPVAAEACYRHAIALKPAHIDAIGNLAVVLEVQGRLDDAFNAYGLLLRAAPGYARGYYLLGLFLCNHAAEAVHLRQSVACLRKAWKIDPRNMRALRLLGVVLYSMGESEAAIQVYRDWLQRVPDDPLALHMLAACGGARAPERAGDTYVRELFDGFASSFDEQLLHNLDYRAPQLLADALQPVLDGRGHLDILDAGCGTGLCAPLLRRWARRLEGVDLSPAMLVRARQRGGYDALVEAELTAHMDARSKAFDVVASADTLVYFGDLHRVVAAAAHALRPGGWLVFSVEAIEGADASGDGVELGPSGRYRHAREHVESALGRAGFGQVQVQARELRKEVGRPVHGWVVMGRLGQTA